MHRLQRVATCLAAAALLLSSYAFAQVLFGSLVGAVNDPSGAAVPNATVTAINKQNGQQRQTTTNDAGGYNFAGLLPGVYEVKVTKEGFRTGTDASVQITANNTTRVDVNLQVGAVSEAINVEATAATLQTDTANVRAEMQSRDLTNLPVPVGRN